MHVFCAYSGQKKTFYMHCGGVKSEQQTLGAADISDPRSMSYTVPPPAKIHEAVDQHGIYASSYLPVLCA